jgi:hypothetical protein
MTQVNKTTLSCSEQGTLDDLMAEGWRAELEKEHEVNFSPGKSVEIISKWTSPIRELRLMSREHPEITFTAELTCMTDEHPITHVLEFANGEEREIFQRPNYSIEFYPPSQFLGSPIYTLLDQAVAIFSRADVKRNEEGILQVDIIAQPMEVTLQDEELQVKVIKEGFEVRVAECLKRKPGLPGKWNDVEKELRDKFSI